MDLLPIHTDEETLVILLGVDTHADVHG